MADDWAKVLIAAAEQARSMAYAPYSRITVGAALLSGSGAITSGANIENAAYAGICAERAAFSSAIFNGERNFRAIAIVGGPAGEPAVDYFYPCGLCRQWMVEFCSPKFAVLAAKSPDDCKEYTLDRLLPHSFGPKHLK